MKINCFLTRLSVILTLTSCTIKEDRDPCPCRLNIIVDGAASLSDRLSVSGWSDNGERLFHDRIKVADYPDGYAKKVKKGFLKVCAVGGIESMTVKDGSLYIPTGKECDGIWAYSGGMVDATGDDAEDKVVLHKNHTRIYFQLDSLTLEKGDVILRLVGNVSGVEMPSLKPVHGDFNCFATMDAEGYHTATVPRQNDDSMILEVFINGILTRTVRIGEIIVNSGYSWVKEDLDDLFLSISIFSGTEVSISINDWMTDRLTYTI